MTSATPVRFRRFRRRERAVVPAERWQRAAGWLIDVTPFLVVGALATLWIDGPHFVVTALAALVGHQVDNGLPSLSSLLDPASPDHHLLGSLILTAVVLVVLVLLWVVYRVVATARYGRTFGKWVVGSTVVRVDDPTRRPSLRQSWARFVVPQASSVIPVPGTGFLPYLSLCVHPRRRGMHDKVAGTLVVKTERPHLPHLRNATAAPGTDADGQPGPPQSVGDSS